jgi:hypothetical protein
MIVGAVMGIVGGGYNFFKQAQKMNRAASEAYRRDYPRRPTGPRSERPAEGGEPERDEDARA